uniref:(northern house mosquito) hypothetical protein n=1 Tax=Culex pipiens TaxID=7175 RepID=A0A8D8CFA0_CULPI
MDVPHDDGQIGLELLRRVGRHHEEALAAKVLLVPGQQQRHIGFAGHPDKRREGPLRALLFLQEVNLQHRSRLFQVLHQLLLLGRRRNVLHIDELLSVHCARRRNLASAEKFEFALCLRNHGNRVELNKRWSTAV